MATTPNSPNDPNNPNRDEELKAIKAANKALTEQAELRQKISSSLEEYVKAIKDLKHKQSVINDLEKQQADLKKKIEDAGREATKDEELKLELLKRQTAEITKQQKKLDEAVKTIEKGKLIQDEINSSIGDGVLALGKGIGNLDKVIVRAYDKLKSLGLFEMDKAIKQSALEMGVLSKEAKGYRSSIENVAKQTAIIGIGVKELTEIQSSYTEELGRNVMMSEKGMEQMAYMAASTTLGAEGAAQMAADMENVGLSTERTAGFVEDSMNRSHKMGLNASKTLKNLASGIKLLNRYNFKEGRLGLEKMARTVTKLGVGMEFAAGMADKLWNVEGAVDMSAQLQVMGGAFAQMADPFHLMYMARNDLNGLTEELANAAAQSAKFNAETKEFDISAMEMHRLKIIAEQTGISYDDLAKAGKNAAKFSKIKSQLTFSVGGGKKGQEMQEFITNKSFLDEKGKAFIKIGNDPKLLSQLNEADKSAIKRMMEEQKTMKERAEDSKTFEETLENFINGLKISLMPFIEAMEPLVKALMTFSKELFSSGFTTEIENFAKSAGEIVTSVGKWIAKNPFETAMIYAGTKVVGFLFEKAGWIANGLLLAKGFQMGTAGGGVLGGLKKVGGGSLGKGAAIGGGLGLVGGLIDANTEETNVWGKAAAGAAEGAALGSLAGPWGMAVGAALGGIIRGGMAYAAGKDAQLSQGPPVHDALIPNLPNVPKPKALESDFSKGRGIIQGGQITPIDNKDDLLAMKKGGTIDNAINQSGNSMKVDFGEITINGKIEVTSPGAPGLSINLLKDQGFKRDISRIVSSEIEKNRNGGKNIG